MELNSTPLRTTERTNVPGLYADRFGDWIAGFADGEGCFLITPITTDNYLYFQPRFVLRLRGDDEPILRRIRDHVGVGTVSRCHPPSRIERGSHPQIVWQVSNKRDIAALVDFFDRHPLHAKKARDFAIWRKAVALYCSGARDHEGVAALKAELETQRRYDANSSSTEPDVIPAPQLRLVA